MYLKLCGMHKIFLMVPLPFSCDCCVSTALILHYPALPSFFFCFFRQIFVNEVVFRHSTPLSHWHVWGICHEVGIGYSTAYSLHLLLLLLLLALMLLLCLFLHVVAVSPVDGFRCLINMKWHRIDVLSGVQSESNFAFKWLYLRNVQEWDEVV